MNDIRWNHWGSFSTSSNLSASNSIRLISWNILAPSQCSQQRYSYTEPSCLEWDNRLARIKALLSHHSADIICLQEVEQVVLDDLKEELEQNGYKSECFLPATLNGSKQLLGLSVFYLASKLTFIDCYHHTFSDTSGKVALINRFSFQLPKGDVRQFGLVNLLLQPKQTAEAQMKRSMQMSELLTQVKTFFKMDDNSICPHIICGDFNALPMDNVYCQLLENGYHSAYMSHSQQEPAFTKLKKKPTSVDDIIATLDYIFYTLCDMFTLTGCLELPDVQRLITDKVMNEQSLLPNSSFPSNHLVIGSEFTFQ